MQDCAVDQAPTHYPALQLPSTCFCFARCTPSGIHPMSSLSPNLVFRPFNMSPSPNLITPAFQIFSPSVHRGFLPKPSFCRHSHSRSIPFFKPPSNSPPRYSSAPVVAWLTPLAHLNASILASASLSLHRVIQVINPSAITVANVATSSHATLVYLHSSHATPRDILLLRSRGLFPVFVDAHATGYSRFAPVALASAAVPLILEKKGDTVIKFFDDPTHQRARLVQQNGVDDRDVFERFVAWVTRVYLPTGFPHTTTPDYISFTKYRTLQNLASAIMQVISTEALLFGLGLGKKVAAGAAATSWVLKDGASYVVKILYGSVFGSKFDDDPKSWRIAADVVEDVGGAIEILTPLFPMRYFLPLASLAVCLRGMSLMTGTATRHVVYRSLAASGMQNTGDIATKGESQGVTMKMIGLGTGIIVSSKIGQNYYALLAAYAALAGIHIAANWKSVQCVQFSFFNKQRASILIESHLHGKPMPTPHEVSSVEKIVLPPWRGFEPAVKIGVGVNEAVPNAESFNEAKALFRGERFLIFAQDDASKVRVLLRDTATSRDTLRAYFTVKKYMHSTDWSQDKLKESYKFMKRNIKDFEKKSSAAGWDMRHMLLTDGLVRVKW